MNAPIRKPSVLAEARIISCGHALKSASSSIAEKQIDPFAMARKACRAAFARFFFSPDDQWLLQIQEFKDQNFHNLAFLYRIEPNGRIWRMEDPLSAAAFKYLEQSEYLPTEHLFHTGAEFETWDFPAGLLRFSIHASCAQYCAGTERIERSLIYNLRKHTFRAATKP